jgi:CBS domain-containing protein
MEAWQTMRADEPVSRIMTEAVVAIEADRPVSEVLDCFFQYPIHHLPVVREGKLVGMLSSADVMKLEFFVPKTTADRARYIDDRLSIDQLIGQPVVSLKGGTSLGEAAERLIEAGVHAAPIVDEADHVLGIVTTTDIMRSLLHGPPRKGMPPARATQPRPAGEAGEEAHYRRKPTDQEYATALRTAEVLHVEARDPRHLGKAMLYLDQRRVNLEKVLELADRFLLTGQDEHTHALLLKAIHAAKRAEEHATGQARVPFPLE